MPTESSRVGQGPGDQEGTEDYITASSGLSDEGWHGSRGKCRCRRKAQSLVDAKNNADSLVYSARKTEDLGAQVNADKQKKSSG